MESPEKIEPKERRKRKKSATVSVGNGTVKFRISRSPSRGCDSFTLAYRQDGMRKRKSFPKLEQAKIEGELVVGRMSSSSANVCTFTAVEGAAYNGARQLLEPSGVPLELAAAEYAEARKRLDKVPLAKAVDFYLSRFPKETPARPVPAVIAEMLKAKQDDGLSETYLRQLKYDMEKFARAFRVNIGESWGRTWTGGCGGSGCRRERATICARPSRRRSNSPWRRSIW